LMVPLALDEVIAMIQFLNHSRKQGKSVWRTFWRGGTLPDASETPREDRKPRWTLSPMLWGVTSTWNLLLSIAVGVWLLFVPDLFGASKPFSDSLHLSGALVVTLAAIALAEAGRSARFLNVLIGAWLVVGSWFLSTESQTALWNAVIAGVALILLSLPLGKIRDRYGSFDPWVVWGSRYFRTKMPPSRQKMAHR